MIGVVNIEHDSLVPDRWITISWLRVGQALILFQFDAMSGILKILGIDNVHFKFWIDANASLFIDESMLIVLRLDKAVLYLLSLAFIIYYLSHNFIPTLDQLVPCLNIGGDEFVKCNPSISTYIYLLEDFLDTPFNLFFIVKALFSS